MSNEYDFYVPNQSDTDNMNQTGSGINFGAPEPPKKERRKRKMPKAVSVACLGLVFGIVGSAAFQTTNFLTDKLLGKTNKTVSTAGSTTGSGSNTNTTRLTQNSSSISSDVSKVSESAMPSVVSITNMSVQEVQSFYGGTRQQESESAGSGIIIGQNDTELLIVTNNHVVEGASTLTVSFIDNESVQAQVKGTDAAKDLAVIAVPLKNISDTTMDAIKIATLGDSTQLSVGEQVVAIGNALGYGQSVTTGIVSAKDRTLSSTDQTTGQSVESEVSYIQTDAAINPGNSGGALLNMNGEVIGINSAKIAYTTVEGMGYAIPVSEVSDIITDLMNQTTREKLAEGEQGYIGIKGIDVDSQSASAYNMPQGAFVSEVVAGGAADKAGITKGAIITKLDASTIDGMTTLKEKLQYYKPGETVKVTYSIAASNGSYEEKTVEVTLQKAS